MTLGERLKAARIREKLSQEFVAKEVGVHRTTIGKYENNECLPSLTTMMKLIKLYNEDANYILYGDSRRIIDVSKFPDSLINKLYFLISKFYR